MRFVKKGRTRRLIAVLIQSKLRNNYDLKGKIEDAGCEVDGSTESPDWGYPKLDLKCGGGGLKLDRGGLAESALPS